MHNAFKQQCSQQYLKRIFEKSLAVNKDLKAGHILSFEDLEEAKTAKRPVFIVTEEEALENEAEGTDKEKTWRFVAKNVRDFAWASSRKFMWDARGYQQGGAEQPLVMAMSFYPKEGGDLWKNGKR